MKRVTLIQAAVVVASGLAASAFADSTSVGSCKDVEWKTEVLTKYPDIHKSCVDVVERDGTKYVKVSGKVRLKGTETMAVRLDHTGTDVTWKPGATDTVQIEGKAVPWKNVVVGQSLRFYMPANRVAVVDISDTAVTPREVE